MKRLVFQTRDVKEALASALGGAVSKSGRLRQGAAGPPRGAAACVLVLPTLLRRGYRPSESPMETMLSFPSPSNRCDFEAMGRMGQQPP